MKYYIILVMCFVITIACNNNAINDLNDQSKAFTLSIITPEDGTIIGNNDIEFTGTADSNFGISKIELAIDSDDYKEIDGRYYWEYTYKQNAQENLLTEGPHEIKIKATDKGNNVIIKNVNIVVNRNEPIGQFLYTPCKNNGIWNKNNMIFQLDEVSANNHHIDTYQYRLNGGLWSSETSIRTPISLSLTNGNYSLEIVVKNNRDVWQDYNTPSVFNWTLNDEAVITNFSINNGDIFTTSPNVTLNINFGNWISSMYFSNTDSDFTFYDSYSDTVDWELTGTPGLKTVNARFEDVWSALHEASDDIYYYNKTVLPEEDDSYGEFFGVATAVSANGAYLAAFSPNFGDLIYGETTTEYNYIKLYKKQDGEWIDDTTVYLPSTISYKFSSLLAKHEIAPRLIFSRWGDVVLCCLTDYYDGDSPNGAVIIFKQQNGTWQYFQTITSPAGINDNALFGAGVDINADNSLIVIGAPNEEINGNKYQGAVYIYELQNGQYKLNKRIIDDNFGNAGNEFGFSVDIEGARGDMLLAVGSPYADVQGLYKKGHVNVYEFDDSDWCLKERLYSDRSEGTQDHFGWDVKIARITSGYYILISAPFEWSDEDLTSRGVVYLYKTNPLNYKFEIEHYFYSTKEIFGSGFGLEYYGKRIYLDPDAEYIIVSAPNHLSYKNYDTPSVYIYEKKNDLWTSQQHIVLYENGTTINHYGYDTGASNGLNTFVVGSLGKLFIYSK